MTLLTIDEGNRKIKQFRQIKKSFKKWGNAEAKRHAEELKKKSVKEENEEMTDATQIHPVQNFINSVVGEKPSEAQGSFEAILHQHLQDKIAARKAELQQFYLDPEPEVEATDEEVEIDEALVNAFDQFIDEHEIPEDTTIEDVLEAFSEEVQLDELSKKTLGSYIKKAVNSAADHYGKYRDLEAAKGRVGDFTNTNEFSRSEKDKVGNIFYDRIHKQQGQMLRKTGKRIKGIEKATERLTK